MEGAMGDDEFMRIRSIVANHFVVRQDQVTVTSSFIDDLEACSLDAIELIMAFEDAFDIKIPDNAAEIIITVQNAVDYIKRRRKLQRPNAPGSTSFH
jgi:acyl carrier protein